LVGVIGAGTIGPDIGYYLLSEIPGLRLVLLDIDPAALERSRIRLRGYSEKLVQRGRMHAERAGKLDANLATTLDYAALADCDWVLEAATEDLRVKRRIFAQVEAVVRPDAIITSNTSSLPAERLYSDLRHPGRATVTHFFAPAHRNPVVEVITWDGADERVVQWLRWLFARTGKVPLVTRDVVCFMLDRIFDNWCNEAAYLLEHATAAQVDAVATEFVHAGPFFVLNLANGNPIIIETNSLQAEEEGAHYAPAPILASVDRWRTFGPGQKAPEVGAELRVRIRDRLLGILVSQSVDILDRDIGAPEDLELGARLAFGLKTGPLALMAAAGEREIDRVLARLAAERAGMPGRKRALADYVRVRRGVLVDRVDGVVVVTIRRPEALNALHDELTDEILEVLHEHERDPGTVGFVITGYGARAFCAGADIGRFPSVLGDAGAAVEYARACSRLLVALDAFPKPVVAALNGLALGGGLELALRCDAIVAVRGVALQFPEITLGIVPGIGGVAVPYRRWPAAAPLFDRMLRTAAKIDSDTAAAHGILDTCASGAELLPSAIARVRALADRRPARPDAPVALAAPVAAPIAAEDGQPLSAEVRRILEDAIRAAAAAPTWGAALEIGYRAFGASACTAAAKEGIAAFSERRKPDFTKTG
jgi:enoyl-CoA hydratase/3-hydroxyacyl-CoA dehydrogenase